jgi:fructose-bisphosphate aldolase class II
MSLSLEQMQANAAKARELYARTRKEGFALGSFNIDNLETLTAVARAAQAKKSPVLVELSHGEVESIGLENARDMVDNAIQEYGIEMYVNLDHSPTVEAAKAGIDVGFEFIHIDISQANHDASLDEIISGTKEVVEYAKKTGALVESEQHYFAGSSTVHTEEFDPEAIKEFFTKPAEAIEFVRSTGIDTFAASIGNLHGLYPIPKQLHIDLLKEVRAAIVCYISLHGGSGTPIDQFRAAVATGVSKININSEMRKAFRSNLERLYKENPDEYSWVKLTPELEVEIQKVVEHHMDAFGSSGKQ